jgi:hypothetical protein
MELYLLPVPMEALPLGAIYICPAFRPASPVLTASL